MDDSFVIIRMETAQELLGFKTMWALQQAIKRLRQKGEELVIKDIRFLLVSKNCYIGVYKDKPHEVI